VKRPSLGSILLGLIPFAATCLSVALWDRVYPMVFGFPFNFFWLTLWLLLTPVCMYSRRVTTTGLFVGMGTGIAIAVFLIVTGAILTRA